MLETPLVVPQRKSLCISFIQCEGDKACDKNEKYIYVVRGAINPDCHGQAEQSVYCRAGDIDQILQEKAFSRPNILEACKVAINVVENLIKLKCTKGKNQRHIVAGDEKNQRQKIKYGPKYGNLIGRDFCPCDTPNNQTRTYTGNDVKKSMRLGYIIKRFDNIALSENGTLLLNHAGIQFDCGV